MAASAWSKPPKITPELPAVLVQHEGYKSERINMNNLPASIMINGETWTRTSAVSENGTYSYGSNGGASSDIANNPHYTVSPYSKVSSKIYNIHYTVPGGGGPARYYYYWDEPKEKRFQPGDMPADIWKRLKFMADKLLFEWTWFYAANSAYGPATKAQVQ